MITSFVFLDVKEGRETKNQIQVTKQQILDAKKQVQDVKKDVEFNTTLIIGNDTIFKQMKADIRTIRINVDTVMKHLKLKN
jgi:ribosomal protein L21